MIQEGMRVSNIDGVQNIETSGFPKASTDRERTQLGDRNETKLLRDFLATSIYEYYKRVFAISESLLG